MLPKRDRSYEAYYCLLSARARFGVDNLLDKEPPIVNLRTVAEGYTQTGVTNGAFYDVLGRRYYVCMTVQF